MKLLKNTLLLIGVVLPLLGCHSRNGFSFSSGSDETSYIEPNSEQEEIYDEEKDSLDGVDPNDLSGLYNAFNDITSYQANIKSYFNNMALYDYYRHYHSNYVQESISLYDQEKMYSYSLLPEHFDSINKGYINKNNNYYSYSKRGNSIEERLANNILDEDLVLVKNNASYQDDILTLFRLKSIYLESLPFTRISKNKYMLIDKEYLFDFVDICAPNLINEGLYMTFSKVTIEINPSNGVHYRIRLYASPTQLGKMIDSHKDEINKPNWYLLFSEAVI